ncbi:DNA replication/repair protein RecF [Candidatus Daviesbacteria bacterium]|nr:DNA replication/repair protein RecF [Candidatus Daviesbacteria bacterium]
MNLQSLSLSHFRNFAKLELSFGNKVLVTGDNSQGKTNLLEAIYFLATTHSFRRGQEKDMIQFNHEVAHIKGVVAHEGNISKLEVTLTRGQISSNLTPIKRLTVDGATRNSHSFLGNFLVVQFWPEDLELVIDSPSLRRRHLDSLLSQVDRQYHKKLVEYDRVIKQRNRLLEQIREKKARESQLEFWDEKLIEAGLYLVKKRREFFEFLHGWTIPVFEDCSWKYQPSHLNQAKIFSDRSRDVAAGATLSGPHRDEFRFLINGLDLAFFGSRGEQRLGVLLLKLAELEYIEQTSGIRPVLLLDDIFSELDRSHRHHVLEIIDQQQTIITATDVGFVDQKLLREVQVIKIIQGKITD